MAALVQQQPGIITTVSADDHAHFNGCDMYKDGRIQPNITNQQLFKDAVRYLVERPGTANRSRFVYTYAELTTLENQVLSQGITAEKISILHVPGVGFFPDNYVNAIHDSGYTPSSLSRDITSCLLPISTGDPGTRTKYPTAKIINWPNWPDRVIDLSPIGYEGITVGYAFNANAVPAPTITITITIPNNVPNSDTTIPIVITSIRSYGSFEQINLGPDYLRAGNTVKNTAILAEIAKVARGTQSQIANAIIEIMKYLIGKALGDTLQAIELHIAIQNNLQINNPTITITTQNTCGFTTDGVLTSRYKSVNCSACLQIGKESGLREVLLYRAGTEAEMLEQIKLSYINNAIKHNNNVIFVIKQSYVLRSINISGNDIPNEETSVVRSKLESIIGHVIIINAILEFIKNNIGSAKIIAASEDNIRKLSAICMANHVFKAGTNKIINIKTLFDDLSTLIEQLRILGLDEPVAKYLNDSGLIPANIVTSLKDLLGITPGNSFVQYIYSLRGQTIGGNVGGIIHTGGDRLSNTKTDRNKTHSFTKKRIRMKPEDKRKKLRLNTAKEFLFEESYGLLQLIIYSIIKMCSKEVFKQAFLPILDWYGDMTDLNSSWDIEQIISSEIIEPIYFILYRRFYYSGCGFFDFSFINDIVEAYVMDKSEFFNITYSEDILNNVRLKQNESKNMVYIVRTLVFKANQECKKLCKKLSFSKDVRFYCEVLNNMADNVTNVFPEISITSEAEMVITSETEMDIKPQNSDPNSVTASFSQPYGGRAKTRNKKNIRNKRTRKGKHHRKTYKKK